MNESVMRLSEVTAQRGSFRVGPVSFTLDGGDAMALVGPNGSGKSTLILTALGLLRRSGGQVEINGQSVDHRTPPKGVGALLAWPGFYDWLSGPQNLALACEADRQALNRVQELIEEVGLSQAEHRPVHAYSTGMTKRLELARALLFDPQILVLDEPTNGLDERAWKWLADSLDKRRQQGCALLIATHDHMFVERLSAQLLEMDSGNLRPDPVS